MALIPVSKTYTYNKKWMWVPVFGWMCWLAGFVAIDKRSPEAKARVVPDVVDRVNAGYSVMIYPEGTRNKTDNCKKLMPMIKTGAFRIAQQTGQPILPVVLDGTNRACYRGICDIAAINITYCKPMYVSKDDSIQDSIDRYRQTVDAEFK